MEKGVSFFLVIILILLQNYGIAQNKSIGNFAVNHYTDETGLPQNSVKSIAPDGAGFIWLATENGLVRFDGQNFYAFTKANSALPSNRFYSLEPNLGNAQSKNSLVAPGIFYGADELDNLIRIQDGKVVIDSLYLKTLTPLSFLDKPYNSNRPTVRSSGLPNAVLDDPNWTNYIVQIGNYNGCFYICNRDHLTYYEQWRKIYSVPFKAPIFRNFFVLDKYLYYFKADGSIVRIDQTGPVSQIVTGAVNQLPVSIQAPAAGELFWNNVTNEVLLYRHKKLFRLVHQSTGHLSTQLLLEDFDLKQNNIRAIYYDSASQRIFMGSATQGLFVFTPKPFQTLTAEGQGTDNNFYSQIPYTSNSVLLPSGIVLGKDGPMGKVFSHRLAGMAVIKADQTNLFSDEQGGIWTKKNGKLMQFDSSGQRLRHTWNLYDAYQFYKGFKGAPIWIGIEFRGLYRLDPFDSIPKPKIVAPIKKSNYFLQESPDILWVGTRNGLYRVHIPTRQVKLINGTQNFNIRHIYRSRSGEIWLSTYGDGFFLYFKNKLTQFPLDDNQYLATSHGIFEDQRGYFWIPTNKGLFQIAHRDLLEYAQGKHSDRPYYLYYTKEQGFLTNEFNGGGQPSLIRLENGYVSIPSLRGLVWFCPEQIDPVLPNKPLIIDRMEINQTLQRIRNDTISLPIKPQQVRFHLTTSYFGNNQNLQMAYQLITGEAPAEPGLWVRINPRDPSILLLGLNAGHYQLVVRKVNGFGLGNYSYKRILIVVPPRWYETWWMRLIMI
ncbi:ligand-binding sensor domain-containing protein, partial [Spirosoma jeollabukense]